MKKYMAYVSSLIILSAVQLYSMDEPQPQNILSPGKQEELLSVMEVYRSNYLYSKFHESLVAKNKEIKIFRKKSNLRLGRNIDESLKEYKEHYGTDPFVKKVFKDFDTFKDKEVPALLKKLSEFELPKASIPKSSKIKSNKKTVLDKKDNKEFRTILASYRASYLNHKLLDSLGETESEIASNVRKNLENLLDTYKEKYTNDPFVTAEFEKLDDFKATKVPRALKWLSK